MTTTNTGKWSEPPPKRVPPYDWEKIAGLLRKNPGRWRKVFDNERTSLAVAIKIGSIKPLHPDKGFEVRTSNNVRGKPRTCTMHVRFNPDKVKED